MDTDRWNAGDMFPVLDLMAHFEFKTPGSVSFRLGKSVGRDSPRLPEMDLDPGELLPGGGDKWDVLLAAGPVFFALGWLDAHHPCDGFHPLRLRLSLPDRYMSWEAMRDLVPQVVMALRLPADVPYKVHMLAPSQQLVTEEPWFGIASTTRWRMPGYPVAARQPRTALVPEAEPPTAADRGRGSDPE